MVSNESTCNTIDIKAAFLQGNKLDRDVHLKPPVEVESDGKLWKLDKCLYGLSDASRVWYFSVRDELLKCGCIQSKADLSLFYWHYDDKLAGLFLMHVDDFFWGGNSAFRDTVISKIISTLQIGKEESGIFKFIGLQIKQDEEKITMNQQSYINGISPIYISKARSARKYDPINKDEIRSLRVLVGQLNRAASQTRPDIPFEVLELSCSLKDPQVQHILQANKCVKKLQADEWKITFPNLGRIDLLKLIVFSDAFHANLPDRFSSAGSLSYF